MNTVSFRSLLLLVLAASLASREAPAQSLTRGGRTITSRHVQAWTDRVDELRREFEAARNRGRIFVLPIMATSQARRTANEAEAVQAVLFEWWRDPALAIDAWDRMWMSLIAATVRAGAAAYVYLPSVDGVSEEELISHCEGALETYEGLSTEAIYWITGVPSDSIWLRDYGPLFSREVESEKLVLSDPWYYSSRPHDDVEPRQFASLIDAPLGDFGLNFEGGNVLANGGGLCLVSSVVLEANPWYSRSEIEQIFRSGLGCENLVIVEALRDYATGHVDMWLAWADRTTLLVGEYSAEQDDVNRSIIEDNVTRLLSGLRDPATDEPIRIVRVPMPSNCPASGGAAPPTCSRVSLRRRIWRTYLNVILVNGTVLMPTYAEDRSAENEARRIWEEQGFHVVPIESDVIIPYAGSFHCIVKTIDVATPYRDGFLRGDCNGDASLDIADPLRLLFGLFLGDDSWSLRDACDVDDTGSLDISDPIYSLAHLFLAGPLPPEPYLVPGSDPTADSLVD